MSQGTVPGNEPNTRPWARGSLRSKSKTGAGPLTASPRHPGVSGSSQPMGRGLCTRASRGSDQARQACWCSALWQEGARGVFKAASAWLAAKGMWWSATAARGRACTPVLAAAQWAAAAAVARSQALVARQTGNPQRGGSALHAMRPLKYVQTLCACVPSPPSSLVARRPSGACEHRHERVCAGTIGVSVLGMSFVRAPRRGASSAVVCGTGGGAWTTA